MAARPPQHYGCRQLGREAWSLIATSRRNGCKPIEDKIRSVADRSTVQLFLERTVTDYRLYGRGQSGNVYKAALMLNLSGLDWSPRLVAFFNPATKAEFSATVNELGELPVLEFGERRLSQSGVILTYLAEVTGKFGAQDADQSLEVLRWLLFDNHRFSSYYATLRFRVGINAEGENPLTEFLRAQAIAAFSVVEAHLRNRDFLLGAEPTIADISMVGYMYFDEPTGIDRSQFPNLQRWTDQIAALPGWGHPYKLMPLAASPVPA